MTQKRDSLLRITGFYSCGVISCWLSAAIAAATIAGAALTKCCRPTMPGSASKAGDTAAAPRALRVCMGLVHAWLEALFLVCGSVKHLADGQLE